MEQSKTIKKSCRDNIPPNLLLISILWYSPIISNNVSIVMSLNYTTFLISA